MKGTLVALLFLSSVPANAHEFQSGFFRTQTCLKTIYKERYIPGNSYNSGYVKSWEETISVPCSARRIKGSSHNHRHFHHYYPQKQSQKRLNTCNPTRTTTGGLIGGGLAATLSKKESYGWSIPLGAVLGMGIANSEC